MKKFKYLLSNSRKFHHVEVAKILYQRGQLTKLICGSPWFKLKGEGIPKNLIDTRSFLNILLYFIPKSEKLKFLIDCLKILNHKNIDKHASKFINDADIFLGLSCTGLETGKLAKKQNKIYICERSSSHIVFQQKIMEEEHKILGLSYKPINKWIIERELEEYENSDFVLVPSKFVENTFIKHKVYKSKVINFGSYQNKFFPIKNFKKNIEDFNVLFVGQLSVRKGLHYLIDGFKKLNHPKKKLHLVGPESLNKFFFRNLIKKNNNNDIFIYGPIRQPKLNQFFNKADVLVLPSLEEGMATVTLQASSAGCPLIVSENTGAAEFVNNNKCGYVIPIRDSQAITDKLSSLADNKNLLNEFSNNALKFSSNYTWENYIDELDLITENFIKKL